MARCAQTSPSCEQAIRNFVNDPDYQPIKKIRMGLTTNANAVMAPDFKIPE